MPSLEFFESFTKPINMKMPGAAPNTFAEATWGLAAYLAMLAGDISVTRVELGKPALEWQQDFFF